MTLGSGVRRLAGPLAVACATLVAPAAARAQVRVASPDGRNVVTVQVRDGRVYYDLPENYDHNPAFQFIRDVPVDWDATRVLAGRIGDYVVVARRQRDGRDWYLGAITDEQGRTFDIPLSFLEPGHEYVAEIYADGKGANWLTNPLPVSITRRRVTRSTRLHLVLAPGGGAAVRLREAGAGSVLREAAAPAGSGKRRASRDTTRVAH